jgi:hypothetical protein
MAIKVQRSPHSLGNLQRDSFIDAHMHDAWNQVKHLTHGDSFAELVSAIQQLQSRLQRFDGLLPKYQRVLSELYEILKIRSMDEVVPAVMELARPGGST